MDIDRKTLKALAADTRLDILKSLGKRRKMPSELSKELDLATSTVVEHLGKLEEAGLIQREETGHKWIYYSLTDKGSALVKPRIPTNFVIVLSVCIIVFFAGFIYYYASYNSYNLSSQPSTIGLPSSQKSGSQETAISSNISNETINCTDSDGGINYYVRGTANPCPCSKESCPVCGIWVDECLNESVLLEYSCNNLNGEQYNCPYGCKDGACLAK